MHVFGHVDDTHLPSDLVNDVLRADGIRMNRILSPVKIPEKFRPESSDHSNLFLLTPSFCGEAGADYTLLLEKIAERATVALILRRTQFTTLEARASHSWGWVFCDLSPEQIRSSLLIASRGISLFPYPARTVLDRRRTDQARIQLLDMRDCAVLMKLSQGASYSSISRDLGLPNSKVRGLVAGVKDKLAVSGRADAGAFYVRFREQIVAHRQGLLNC